MFERLRHVPTYMSSFYDSTFYDVQLQVQFDHCNSLKSFSFNSVCDLISVNSNVRCSAAAAAAYDDDDDDGRCL